MTKHPIHYWEWEENAEVSFNEWFNGDYGSPFSLRSEWFYGDAEVEDQKLLKDLMYQWLHSSFIAGYNMGRMEGLSQDD